ncbi:hypothetical protein ENKO_43780 (plasmid) [Enterobacter kobei]|uniref:Uncharacterized protein n=2 Tax=Enterobacter kobei TaxID=208224 RepID=A0AA86IV73_9ENTR|nr:hypothetical protein BH713_21840 [Enterobacter kobei]BCU57784.1 hypothetical protein ENKO_43780 [Enterobacter kobei]
MQLLHVDHLKKQNQKIKDAGPLRLPVFAGSSSPTAPGPLLAHRPVSAGPLRVPGLTARV